MEANKITCKYCNYEWKNREPEPKACPRCKRRFDYPITSPDVKPQEGVVKNNKEVDKNEK